MIGGSTAEARGETYDIKIDDSALNEYDFEKFSLPLNGNSSNTMMMTVWNKDNSRTVYCPFYRLDLDRSIKSLEQKLQSEEWLDDDTARGLVTYFRNECLILKEDENSGFFNGKGKRSKKQKNDNNNDGNDGQDSQTIPQIALGLVEEQCSELFLDQFGSPYAAVRINEHIETLPLKSSRFKNWLCRIFYRSEQDVLNNESVTNVLNILKARAEFDGTPRNLHLRVAKVPTEAHTIFCDLTNKEWLAVKITENGWTVEYAPIIFKRYSNQQPQVYPSKEYTQDIFDEFMQLINVKGEDNKLLLKCYIISLFYPDIPKPILMLHGEQGSAKSTLQELIKMLVDPSSIRTLTFPRDISELIQKLSHNYIAYFDNMSSIPEWISDQLCRAVTGSGFSKRELYSDDDDIIYNFKRCVGLNGINLAATKADLLDRGIIIELERILKDKIRRIEEIWKEFEKIKPQLLGYIFDILAKVLQVERSGGISNEINGLPRMADFAEIGEIISRCMGYDNNRFLRDYNKNIELQTEEAIQAHPIGNAIVKFMEVKQEWKGTATELLAELEQIADQIKINTNYRLWPKSPNSLSRRLNEVKTNLREIGIIINRSARDQKTNSKTIEICKTSLISLESLADKNHAQVTSDIPNDIDDNANDISLEDKISLGKTPQNHAQNSISNDTNDTNDILHTSQEDQEEQKIPESVYRLGHSDTFACHNCKSRGDKWFMMKHHCRQRQTTEITHNFLSREIQTSLTMSPNLPYPSKKADPFVKWAGGKTQLLPQLSARLPAKFDRYFEPFLGGGALFFYLMSNKNKRFTAFISDINSELMNSYVVIKENVEKLIILLTQQENEYNKASEREEKEKYYYQLRNDYNLNCPDRIERAAQLITLNRTCFNGLYRVNPKGEFNVPLGKYKNPTICNSSNLRNVSNVLCNPEVTIKACDYKEALLDAREGDFIYLDPPYIPVSSTAYFTSYTKYEFSPDDQKDLASVFRKLDERGCKVMLTNSDTPSARELYSDYAKYNEGVDSKRSINSKGSKREGHTDLIIRNYS